MKSIKERKKEKWNSDKRSKNWWRKTLNEENLQIAKKLPELPDRKAKLPNCQIKLTVDFYRASKCFDVNSQSGGVLRRQNKIIKRRDLPDTCRERNKASTNREVCTCSAYCQFNETQWDVSWMVDTVRTWCMMFKPQSTRLRNFCHLLQTTHSSVSWFLMQVTSDTLWHKYVTTVSFPLDASIY